MIVVRVEEWPDGDADQAYVLAVASADMLEVIHHDAIPEDDEGKGRPASAEARYEIHAAVKNKPDRRFVVTREVSRFQHWLPMALMALKACERRTHGPRPR